MNTKLPSEQEGSLSDAVEQAEQLFEHARQDLFDLIAEIKAGKTDRLKQLHPILSELRRGSWTVYDERKRAHENRKRDAGIVHDYALDFDKARDEIQRRLDRLRATEGPGGVSG